MAPEELIDVLTPDGEFTGETLPKSIVHHQGLWHACVHGIITDGNGQLLVQFRGPKVNHMRNVWDPMGVAGHISAYTGDPAKRDLLGQARDTLIREAEEELGVILAPEEYLTEYWRMIGITRTNQPTEDGWMDRTLSVNYLLVLPRLDPAALKLEPGKVLAAEWRHVSEVAPSLAAGEGDLYAVRNPDHCELIQGACDAVRRVGPIYPEE